MRKKERNIYSLLRNVEISQQNSFTKIENNPRRLWATVKKENAITRYVGDENKLKHVEKYNKEIIQTITKQFRYI